MKDEWMDYFGHCTAFDCGSHGLHVHHPGTGERAEYAEDDAEQGSSEDGDSGGLGQDYGRDDTGKEEKQEMTHEQFKDICLKEFPLIEGMVKTVKALGAKKVSCDVWEDGHIHFDISTQDNLFIAYHASTAEKGSLSITAYDIKRDPERCMHFENPTNLPECFYETIPEADPDTTEDDLPFA